MTLGHLLFSLATTGYIFRGNPPGVSANLAKADGEAYLQYRMEVRMLVPIRRRTSR